MTKVVDNQKRTEELRTKPVSKLLMAYALPAVIGTVVNALYNIADRIFIGQGVGAMAIAGLTLTFPIMIFLQAFGMLVGAGASVRVSIALGKDDHKEAEKILANAIMLTILISAATIVPCFIYLEPLLRLFGASDETMPYALEYLKIIVPGNIFATLSFGYNAIMRASGYPQKAMYYMVLGAVLNLVLDALFIYGFNWGIEGAAWATVISMFVTMIFVMLHFANKHSLVRFRASAMIPSKKVILSIMSIGVAPFAMQLVGSAVQIVVNRSFVHYASSTHESDIAIGVYGIINSYAMLVVMFVIGMSQGMQPIVGFNYGAKLPGRVHDTYMLTCKVNSLATFIGWTLVMVMPGVLTACFTTSPEMIEMSKIAMRVAFSAFLFVGFQITTTQFFQSIGMPGKAIFMSLSRQVLSLLPLLIILPRFMGMVGIWVAMPISDFIAAVIALILVIMHIKTLKISNNL
ncbi:MATE family efflux transporter [Falsiporphyromonas endometrii]|uniref:Multidrug export protein MepA n=1 Tax=Falsiporphyromonas endometrii TaxID=1387297 RepID=A0ABV9K7G1_9PORP